MRETIYNYDLLSDEEITETVIRCKALIINSKGEILIANENDLLHFPGGHLDQGEGLIDCLKREVKEETGINLDEDEIGKCFMKVTYKNRDWPKKGNNRKSEIYYYIVTTDKDVDLTSVHYTENEKENNFKIDKISLPLSIQYIEGNIPKDPKNRSIAPDMIDAINEYIKQLS